jgi:hypothetical protein
VGGDYFVLHALIVKGYRLLCSGTLIEEQVLYDELVLIVISDFEFSLFGEVASTPSAFNQRLRIEVQQIIHLLIIDLKEGDVEEEPVTQLVLDLHLLLVKLFDRSYRNADIRFLLDNGLHGPDPSTISALRLSQGIFIAFHRIGLS